MSKEGAHIDRFDRHILDVISTNGRITITELADRIGLSATPCKMRLRKLEARGFITGYRASVDQTKLGRSHITFVQVCLSDTRDAALKAFNEAALRIPEIEECHMIAGGFDYLLKVRTSDIAEYRAVLGTVLSALPHVSNTTTFVAMEAVRE
ncbi:Lrp/AsnC ligand binding domain-containing protein [Pelagibacterium halotolerans]|uniref:Lrp/AsnC ligand binding domain-containing protein n=1 Tax=Pelagibacterium halotolerans TaxID=531813 RepID=UPI0038503D06